MLVGIPALRAEIIDCVAEGNKVYARLTVRGTNAGTFYGAPPTHQTYHVSVFDYVELVDGKIVERVQQSDALSQLRQIYAAPLKRTGIVAGSVLAGSIAALVTRSVARRARA